MQEFWIKETSAQDQRSVDKLTHPRTAQEIKQFQEVITILREAGHQVYVSLYAGIPHIKEDPCDDDQH